ncbi:MAG TPA: GNAT family N-acetyltransferase [Myxococcales bacterium]|nr:GNAT family N-acetyltransferase [Myxococcales bacterium]
MTQPALERFAATAEIVTDRATWGSLRGEWNRLAARSPVDCPMLRHEWFSAFLDAFAPDESLHVVIIRREGVLIAAAALVRRLARWHGFQHVALTALANPHSARFDVLADGPDALRSLWRALRACRGWDTIELRDVPDGGAGAGLAELASLDGHATDSWESMQTPYILLDRDQISSKFAQNLRRRRRRLEEIGQVDVQEVTGGPEVDAFLERGLALEAAGWKGRERTAIACRATTRAFYRSVAREAEAAGGLAFYGLTCGRRLVAFHFGLRHGGRYLLPKPAYDESLGACSPGQLLMAEVVSRSRASGLVELDFLGPAMPWKLDWTPRVRRHHWHWIYAPTLRGRALWLARAAAAKPLKRWAAGAVTRVPWRR